MLPLVVAAAKTMGALVNAAIPALCGIWMIWESTRIHATEEGDENVREPLTEEKAAKKRAVFRNMGIVLILIGIGYFVMDMSRR